MNQTTTRAWPVPTKTLAPVLSGSGGFKQAVACLLGLAGFFVMTHASSLQAAPAAGRIVVAADASAFEQFAARELQRHIYQISGSQLEIGSKWALKQPCFVIGQAEKLAAMKPSGAEPWRRTSLARRNQGWNTKVTDKQPLAIDNT
jgi:hypothetical protein